MINLIAFSGAARAGKDTLADILVKYHGYKKIAFADPLKEVISKAFNIPLEELYSAVKDNPYKAPVKLSEDHIKLLEDELSLSLGYEKHRDKEFISHRDVMQYVGTEICRGEDPNIWLKMFEKAVSKYSNVVCSDMRLPNERSLIKDLGGTTILIKRPGFEPKNHASEADFGEDSDYDVVITNDGKKISVEHEFRFWYRQCYEKNNQLKKYHS